MSCVFKEVHKDIHRLKKKCKNLKAQLLNNLSGKDYKTYAAVRNKVRYMEKAMRRRHSRKLSRGKITDHFFFFLSGVSFTDTDNSQDSWGREGTFSYSTLPLPTAHEHSDIYVQFCT